MGRGQDPVRSAADMRRRLSHFGHERCIELAGIYAGFLVEPNPASGLGSDGCDRRLLQLVGRLWCTSPQSGRLPDVNFTDSGVHLVLSHRGHGQPTWRRHSRATAKSNKLGSIPTGALTRAGREGPKLDTLRPLSQM